MQSTRNGARMQQQQGRSLRAELPEPREYKDSQSPENLATPVNARER